MVISIVEAERLNHPDIEEEVIQMEKLIDYHIKKHYPSRIPRIKLGSAIPRGVIRRLREIYMDGGWIVDLISPEGDPENSEYLQIINPERPY